MHTIHSKLVMVNDDDYFPLRISCQLGVYMCVCTSSELALMNCSEMAKHQGPHRHLRRLIIDEQAHLGLNLPNCRSGPAAFSTSLEDLGMQPSTRIPSPSMKHPPEMLPVIYDFIICHPLLLTMVTLGLFNTV